MSAEVLQELSDPITESPFTVEELESRLKKHGFTPLEIEKATTAAQKIILREAAFQEIEKRNSKDPSALFKEIFYTNSLGNIKIMRDMGVLGFVCDDIRDFSVLSTWRKPPKYKGEKATKSCWVQAQ